METGWWEIPHFASGHYLVEAIGGKIASEQDNNWILMEEAAAKFGLAGGHYLIDG